MRINNNLMAMNTHRQLSINNTNSSKSIEKLSSGYRVNRAGDDAAGLAISEKMRGQIRGLNQASNNSQNAISLIQTAEGALTESHAILQRMRELAVQSATDTNVGVDRDKIQAEVDQLSRELTRVAQTTEFNTQKLLNGDKATDKLTFQIGANEGQNVELDIQNMDAKALDLIGNKINTSSSKTTGIEYGSRTTSGVTITVTNGTSAASSVTMTTAGTILVHISKTSAATVDDVYKALQGSSVAQGALKIVGRVTSVAGTAGFSTVAADAADAKATTADYKTGVGIAVDTRAAADKAITTIDNALNKVSEERSKLGAMQNRLEHTIKNLDTSSENLQASESRIRDVDMAKEMMEYTKNNILQQAAQAMLAQANQAPQGVLQLLR